MAGENSAIATQPGNPSSSSAGSTGAFPATSQASTAQPQTAQNGSQQSASEPAKGNGAPLKTPLIADPKAFIERARQRAGWGASKTAEPVKPAETAKPADAVAVQAAPAAETKPPEAKPTDPVDDMAARVARLSREQREFEHQRRTFDEAQAKAKTEREESAKQHEAKLKRAEVAENVEKAIEAGDVLGAIRMLKADVNPSAFTLQLLEQLQKEDERPMSQAEVDRMIADRLKTEQEAREKAAEEKRKADEESQLTTATASLESARDGYMSACAGQFSKEKHPFIAAHGLKRKDVIAYAESQRDDLGRLAPPDPESLLNHFETTYRKRAEAAGWAPKVPVASTPNPAPSFSQSSLAQDSGGRLAPERPRRTLEEDRAEIRRKLRVGGTQT